ncbi:MAG TPA: hypothetical protein VMZ91_13485 [Candidatus Paceibacterota bacterium]|nr:hypothetical protein [Candidatus Paceibacterota bacterium]
MAYKIKKAKSEVYTSPYGEVDFGVKREKGIFSVKKSKEDKAKKLFLQNIKQRGTITEKELLLVKRRLNDGKTYKWEDVEELTDLKLTPEQNQKGIAWLKNKGWGKTGIERSTTPYGYREEEALKNVKEIKLNSFTNRGYGDVKNFVPVYDVYTKEGYGFQYIMKDDKPSIIG